MIIGIVVAVAFFGILFYLNHEAKLDEKLYNKQYVPESSELVGIENSLLIALTINRMENKKSPVRTDKLSKYLAFIHNQYMIEVNELSHHGMGWRAMDLMELGAKSVGECVGWGNNSGVGFIKKYIDSPEHQPKLVGDYTHVGISCELDRNNRYYNTLIFIKI